MIRLQEEDFDVGKELARLGKGKTQIGAIASFVGVMRDSNQGAAVAAMTLEHYPGMTEAKLSEIEAEAHKRWELAESLIIHRTGELVPGDNIVMVAVASAHREAAFEACRFLIDWLKTQAPLWKHEDTEAGGKWVASRASDDKAAGKWKGKKGKPATSKKN